MTKTLPKPKPTDSTLGAELRDHFLLEDDIPPLNISIETEGKYDGPPNDRELVDSISYFYIDGQNVPVKEFRKRVLAMIGLDKIEGGDTDFAHWMHLTIEQQVEDLRTQP